MTQIGQEQPPAQAAFWHAPPAGPARQVMIEPGTLMEKPIPAALVDPYLTGQRWVITGFAYPMADAPPAGGEPERWILRWRALHMQAYLAVPPAREPGRASPGGLFVEPGPIPVGTEMYRVTAQGEEFIARHDGQAWVGPALGPKAGR